MKKEFFKYVSRNIAGMIGTSVYILADTYFIALSGGTNGITILNLAIPLYGLLFALGSLIGIGSATRFSIDKASNNSATSHFFSHALLWQLIISIPFILLGILSPKTWFTIMGGDSTIATLGESYIKIVLIAAPLFMLNYSFTAFSRNDNAPTTAMIATVGSSIFNIVFDYIFVFPMKMGITGAALATAMAPAVSMLICLTHINGRNSSVKFIFVKPSFRLLVSSAKLGVAAFVGEISSAITTTVFNFLLLFTVGNFGVAAYGIVTNLALVVIAIFNGLAQGMQPLLSKYFGMQKEEAVRSLLKMGLFSSAIIEIISVGLCWIFATPFVSVFNSENDAMLGELATSALHCYSLGFLVAGINITLISYFAATGKALTASISSILRGAVAIIICAFAMTYLFGVTGIWFSFLVSESVTLMVTIILATKLKE